MKEEIDETTIVSRPSEADMNDMHKNAWLDFHCEAQQAKQDLNRRYARTVGAFGSYKKMPHGVKENLKQAYDDHEAKWGEFGSEAQKRFGVTTPEPVPEYQSLVEEKEQFLAKLQQQRETQSPRNREHER